MFCGCTVLPDSKETELGSSEQEASPSAGKNTGIVLVPWKNHFRTWKCAPTAISGGYTQDPLVSFVTTDEFSLRVTKITSGIGVS